MFNDLAKAVAHFEIMIKENEISISRAYSNPEDQEELAEINHHYAVAIDAMQLILSDPVVALRLQQLRMMESGLVKETSNG